MKEKSRPPIETSTLLSMQKVLVTGSSGMLGRNVASVLEHKGMKVIRHTRFDADLEDADAVERFIADIMPETIVHCAALVGGIRANLDGGASFYFKNVKIDNNVLFVCAKLNVPNLIYVGSSCMYPANRTEKLIETDLLTGKLEPTNYYYALAKISGTTLTQSIAATHNLNWKTFIASNLYGPHDHFGSMNSHLLAAIISRILEAKKLGSDSITMWGDGKPRREFTYVLDFAEWIAMNISNLNNLPSVLNVGYGEDFTVREYYEMVMEVVNVNFEVIPDLSKPSGNQRKLMDSSLAEEYGWKPSTSIKSGIAKTVSWYETNCL